ncbi:hypothetical protein NN561_014489 [Cricetulus griseus]
MCLPRRPHPDKCVWLYSRDGAAAVAWTRGLGEHGKLKRRFVLGLVVNYPSQHAAPLPAYFAGHGSRLLPSVRGSFRYQAGSWRAAGFLPGFWLGRAGGGRLGADLVCAPRWLMLAWPWEAEVSPHRGLPGLAGVGLRGAQWPGACWLDGDWLDSGSTHRFSAVGR